MKRWVVLVFVVLCLNFATVVAEDDDEACPGGVCDEKDAPKKNKYQKPGAKKNKYQKPGAKKNKYQKPGAKKNKYQKPGAKKNKYQRTDVAEGGEDGGYSFDDPHANHMAQGIKFDEDKQVEKSLQAFGAAVKFGGTSGDYMNLGVALMRAASFHSRNPEHYDESEKMLLKAQEMDPDNSNVVDNLKALQHSMEVDDIYVKKGGAPKKKKKYQRPKKKKKYQ